MNKRQYLLALILLLPDVNVKAFTSPVQSVSVPLSLCESSSVLFHMGHSHGHHHHHEIIEDKEMATKLSPKIMRQRNRRRLALVLFCWFATCFPPLLKHRIIAKHNWLAFLGTSVVLTSAEKLRRSVRNSIQRFSEFKDGIVKHAPQSKNTNLKFQNDAKEADRVTWIGVVVNLLLSVGKLLVGVTSHSSALIADAGHSLSDLVSDFITLWTVQIARLPADEDHPYGHWKFEGTSCNILTVQLFFETQIFLLPPKKAIGSLFLSLTLIATAFSVGSMANKQLLQLLSATKASTAAAVIPGPLALVMAGISICSKEWLYRITKTVGEKIRSQVVIANAWHHRSDAYSSVLALCSIAWARTGFPAADAAAGLFVAGMIGMTGGDILVESVQQLSDGANPRLQKEALKRIQVLHEEKDQDDVLSVESVKARQVGSLSLIEVQLRTSSDLSTTAARAVEERWKQWLKKDYGYEAIVHAKPDLVICPLLTKQLQDDDHEPSKPEIMPSAGSIEFLARQQALLSSQQVERVTVHYNYSKVSVDMILSQSLPKHATNEEVEVTCTLSDLCDQGKQLKESLQELDEIDEANIYWDLSAKMASYQNPK